LRTWHWAALAVAGMVVAGGFGGWQAVVFGMTLVVTLLVVEILKVLKLMRRVEKAPVGRVENAVMLQARLKPGLSLTDLLKLTGCLGRKLDLPGPAYAWEDDAGDRVEVTLAKGRLASWQLRRAEPVRPGP